MRDINAAGFVRHGNNLMLLAAPSRVFQGFPKRLDPKKNVTEDARVHCRGFLQSVRSDCEVFGLPVTLAGVNRMLDKLNSPAEYPYAVLDRDATDLLGRFIDELDVHLFLAVDTARARFYTDSLIGWEDAIMRFTDVSFDIEEAGKCLALNRGTACVFHLMRVLEVGMYALADDLGVDNIQENWQNAIQQIEKAARDLTKSDPMQQFASEAAAYLFHVKDAWRNSTVHSGPIYPTEHAERIYENVRGFMQHLATRPQEQS